MSSDARAIADHAATVIIALVDARGPDKSICPSEAARVLAAEQGQPDEWRSLMQPVRDAAYDLAQAGTIEITQRGVPCDVHSPPRGPIRLRIAVV